VSIEEFLFYLFIGVGLPYMGYQFYMMMKDTFVQNEDYIDDDERLYNPLTGKYYDIDFDGNDVIYKETQNQQDSTLNEKNSKQEKFHTYRKYLEESFFEPIIGEDETDEIFVWIQNFDLVNSILEVSQDILYFKYQNIVLALFIGNNQLEIGQCIIFSSDTFVRSGIISYKPELHQKIEKLFPSETQEKLSPHLDKHLYIYYEDSDFLRSKLSSKAIGLLECTEKVNIEFKDGTVILFQEEEATQNQLTTLLALAQELK